MYKITIQDENMVEIGTYHSAIVPVISDTISFDYTFYKVTERTLFNTNPHFVIVRVKPNC
jgi:hypothetical protein